MYFKRFIQPVPGVADPLHFYWIVYKANNFLRNYNNSEFDLEIVKVEMLKGITITKQ